MRAIVRAGIVVALLSALAQAAFWASEPGRESPTLPSLPGSLPPSLAASAALCPAGTLPDEGVCIPVPESHAAGAAARDHSARSPSGTDLVRRRPDRPAELERYVLPVELLPGEPVEWAESSALGLSRPLGGVIALPQRSGAPVRNVTLDGQKGPARVLRVEPERLAVSHPIDEAGRSRTLVVVYLGLLPDPSLRPELSLEPSSLLGQVRALPGRPLSRLGIAVRRPRPDTELSALSLEQILQSEFTVGIDPRNAFPLRSKP